MLSNPPSPQRLAHLLQNRRIIDRRRHGPLLPVRDFLHRSAQNLPRARLRQALDWDHGLEGGDGADAVADEGNDFAFDVGGRAVDAGVEDDEAAGHLALHRVGHTDDGAFGDVGVFGEDFLHRAGRQAVAGDVDDVVGAGHDEEVAVLVDDAGVGRLVVAGELGEIGAFEALVGVPERRQAAGRQGEFRHHVS